MNKRNDVKGSDEGHIGGFLTISRYRDGQFVSKSAPMKNKVVSSEGYGRNLILRALKGDATYPIVIDSAAVGDDDTAPADADTGLGNELVGGIPITNMTVADNVITVDVFVADGNLPDNDYKEFALKADERIMVRILISPTYSKVPGEDTLFTYTGTLTG